MDFDLDKEYEEKDIKKEPKPVDDGFDILLFFTNDVFQESI